MSGGGAVIAGASPERAGRKGILARLGTWAIQRPATVGSAVFLLFALPALAMPLAIRDYYHLERAEHYSLARFWEADDIQFKEYFWWPFDGFYCRFLRPLWSGSVALMYEAFGLSAVPHRLFATILQLLSITLLAAVLQRAKLYPRTALVAVLVYVVHPAWSAFALEPIAVGSANAIPAIFAFGALLSFMRWRDSGWRPGYWLTLAATACALLAKEIGIVVAPMLVAFDVLVPAGDLRRPVGALSWTRRHAGWCGLTALHLLTYLTIVSTHNHLRQPYYLTWGTDHFAWRLVHQIGLYGAQTLFIGVYHPLADAEFYMGHPALFVAFVSSAVFVYAWIVRRTWKMPWARFAMAFLLLSILPVIPVIVQVQEFALPSAASGILLAIGLEQASARRRVLLEVGAIGVSAVSLSVMLLFCAAIAGEAHATRAAFRAALPSLRLGARVYFINTPEYTWLGEASAIRLIYADPTIDVQHLSFDCCDLPPNPTTLLGRAATASVALVAPGGVGTCTPAIRRRSDRSFSLTIPGHAFFDSDLGRFILQGRAPFRVGETMHRGDFEARVERMVDDRVVELSFDFDTPLESADRVFVVWNGTRPDVIDWAGVPRDGFDALQR